MPALIWELIRIAMIILIQVLTGIGPTTWIFAQTVLSTPSAPSTLTVTVVSASQLNLKWTDHSGIETGFKVERATASGGPFLRLERRRQTTLPFLSTGLYPARDIISCSSLQCHGQLSLFQHRQWHNQRHDSGRAEFFDRNSIPMTTINLVWACNAPNEDGFRIYSFVGRCYFHLDRNCWNQRDDIFQHGVGLEYTQYCYKVVAYNTAGNSAYSPMRDRYRQLRWLRRP